MRKALKGQTGIAGPAEDMMRAMGIHLPQEADDESKSAVLKH